MAPLTRRDKINEFLYVHPFALSTGTADGDVAATSFQLPPAQEFQNVVEWGVHKVTAGTGTALITAQLQRTSDNAVLASDIVIDLDAAADTRQTAEGNSTKIDSAERIKLNLNFDAGTATGAGTFLLFIRFRK